jgi:hypothetical protein
MTAELQPLAEAWIALQNASKTDRETLFWAFQQLDGLVDDDPNAAWRVIDLIWRNDDSDLMLARVAAGPLEDLLVRHGPQFIDRVTEQARREPVFRKMLGGVWRDAIAEPVWLRLKEVAGPSF